MDAWGAQLRLACKAGTPGSGIRDGVSPRLEWLPDSCFDGVVPRGDGYFDPASGSTKS